MGIIKLLPENLINQIAAGEVIERPASAVKELMENSIDAGATQVFVEVKNGGMKLIRISDNGNGIYKDDLGATFVKHATSKIAEEADLWKIKTLGFRGEALASIASIAKIKIKSLRAESPLGFEISSEGGKLSSVQETAMNQGTVIEVEDLFFNVPVRQKYLKNEATEFGYLSSVFLSIALANFKLSFQLIHNGKIVYELPKVTDLLSRIHDVFGKDFADCLIPIFYGGQNFQLEGFIAKPALSRSTSKNQYLFVNGRAVTNNVLATMVKSAYHTLLMEHKKPVFFLNLTIPAEDVDVNVHPRKLEVRFLKQGDLNKVIFGAVKSALDKSILMPKAVSQSSQYTSDYLPSEKNFSQRAEANKIFPQDKFQGLKQNNFEEKSFLPEKKDYFSENANNSYSPKQALEFTKSLLNNVERKPQNLDLEKTEFTIVLGQISNAYIIAKKGESLILIDQHAAHERVRYEELMDQAETQKKAIQPLLIPTNIELTGEEAALLNENMAVFNDLGYEIDHFGGQTFIIREVPLFLAKENQAEALKGVLDDLFNQKNATKFQGKTEAIITYMSCRSAIKFGQSLNVIEMQALISQMEKLKRPYTCPHGRPTMVELNMDELARMFGRK